jgi:hypothetical protein
MTLTNGRKRIFTTFGLKRKNFCSLCFNLLYVKHRTGSQKNMEAGVADFSKTRQCQI